MSTTTKPATRTDMPVQEYTVTVSQHGNAPQVVTEYCCSDSSLSAPFAVRHLPDQDSSALTIALVQTAALLLSGDDLVLRIVCESEVRLRVVEVSATVAYSTPDGASAFSIHVELQENAVLVWEEMPFVVAEGATTERSLVASLSSSSILCLRETLVLGRTYEDCGNLTSRTSVFVDAKPVLVEEVPAKEVLRLPGVAGDAHVIDQLLIAGYVPAALTASSMLLAFPGVVERRLCTSAHQSDLHQQFNSWTAELWSR